jgi:hypothetical protein
MSIVVDIKRLVELKKDYPWPKLPEEFKILSFSRFEPKFTYNNVVLSQNSHHDDVLRSSKFLF